MRKNEKAKPRFWTVLAVLSVAGIAFPLGYYLQTDGAAQIFGAMVLVSAVLFLLIVDGVAALFGEL